MSTPAWKAPSPLKGSRRSAKAEVMCPAMGQRDGVYVDSANPEGISRRPELDSATAVAFFLRKLNCSMELSKAPSESSGLSATIKGVGRKRRTPYVMATSVAKDWSESKR